jgi:hypothetical protein
MLVFTRKRYFSYYSSFVCLRFVYVLNRMFMAENLELISRMFLESWDSCETFSCRNYFSFLTRCFAVAIRTLPIRLSLRLSKHGSRSNNNKRNFVLASYFFFVSSYLKCASSQACNGWLAGWFMVMYNRYLLIRISGSWFERKKQ